MAAGPYNHSTLSTLGWRRGGNAPSLVHTALDTFNSWISDQQNRILNSPTRFMCVGSFRDTHVHRVGRIEARLVVGQAVSSRAKPAFIRSRGGRAPIPLFCAWPSGRTTSLSRRMSLISRRDVRQESMSVVQVSPKSHHPPLLSPR